MEENICTICGKIFKLKSDLKRHNEKKKRCDIIIPKSDIYVCKICGYYTNNKTHYIRHINRKKSCTNSIQTKAILEKIRILEEDNKLQKESHYMEMQQLKRKIEKQKRPINYNFIINNFTNASNIEDCLSFDNITSEIIEKCKNMPLKDGSTFVLNSLCDINPELRPIHCTDTSRLNFMVRSNDSWNVDTKGLTISDHLSPVLLNLYNGIYKERMENKKMTKDEKLELFDIMSKELLSENITKCSNNAIKISSTKFAVKNIDNELQLDNTYE